MKNSWQENLKKNLSPIPRKGDFFICSKRPQWIAVAINYKADWVWYAAGDLVFDVEDCDPFPYSLFFKDSKIVIL